MENVVEDQAKIENNTKDLVKIESTGDGKTTLLDLYEDVWVLIFKNLEIEDHIHLANTCQYLAIIVQQLYGSIKVLRFPGYEKGTPNQMWTYNFIKCISCTLEVLKLKYIDFHHISLLRNIKFPNLKELLIWIIDTEFLKEDDKFFYELISDVSLSIEKLTMENILWKHFKMLKEIIFPKVTYLRVGCNLLNITNPFRDKDEAKDDDEDEKNLRITQDSELIAKMFPSIKKLTLSGFTTGYNVWKLESLTELNLYRCLNFETTYLRHIFSKLKLKKFGFILPNYLPCMHLNNINDYKSITLCKTLEEIEVDYHNLRKIQRLLPKLENLRNLTYNATSLLPCSCKYVNYFPGVIKHFENVPVRIIFCDVKINPYHHKMIMNLKNVRGLVFDYCDVMENEFESIEIVKLPFLREFRMNRIFSYCKYLKYLIFYILRNSPLLEIFDVCENAVGIKFIIQVIECLKKHRKNDQNNIITLYLRNSYIKPEELKELFIPNFIKIKFEQSEESDYFEESRIQILSTN